MDYLKSAQSFVRALKASADPPIAGAPAKIVIARNAWDTQTFVVPNKGEVILEWMFSKFSKERHNTDSLADIRYWHLLRDIISSSPSTKTDKSLSSSSWLSFFFAKITFAPLLTACLGVLGGLEAQHAEDVSNAFAPCFDVIWPLSTHKMSSEVLFDCFGAFLHLNVALARHTSFANGPWPSIRGVGVAVTRAYRASFQNAPNRKKLCTVFLAQHFTNWVSCASAAENDALACDAYAAGVETFFNFDNIRHSASAEGLPAAFENALEISLESLMDVLPRVCASLVDAARKHKSVINQSAGSGDTVNNVRHFILSFVSSCLALAARVDQFCYVWKARNALLSIVDQERLFHSQDSAAQQLFVKEVERAIAALDNKAKPEYHSLAIETLTLLARIEFDVISPAIPRLLSAVAFTTLDQRPQSVPLLQILLEHHSKTRSLPLYISQVFDTFQPSSLHDTVPGTYRAGFAGPILSIAHLNQVHQIIRAFSSSAQVTELADIAINTLERRLNTFASHAAKLAADNGEGARKKRRTSRTPSVSEADQDLNYLVCSFAFTVRLSGTIITALATKASSDGLDKLTRDITRLNEVTLRPALVNGIKAIRKRQCLETNEWQIGLTALVQFQSILSIHPRLRLEWDEEGRKLYSKLLKQVNEGTVSQELTVITLQSSLRRIDSASIEDSAKILESVLQCLEQTLVKGCSWSGRTFELSEPQQTGVALLYILLRRWLGDFEATASTSHLERLATLLLTVSQEPPSVSDSQTAADSLSMLMCSAEFWEMGKLKEAITSAVISRTAFLDSFELDVLLSTVGKDKQTPVLAVSHQLDDLKPVLCFLLYSPLEYLPRVVRAVLHRRLMIADILVSYYTKDMEGHERVLISTLIREFLLQKAKEQMANTSFVKYLADGQGLPMSSSHQNVTRKLLRMQLSPLLQSSEIGQNSQLIFDHFTSVDVTTALENGSPILDGLQIFIDLVIMDHNPSTLSSGVDVLLRGLYNQLVLSIKPAVEAIIRNPDLSERTLATLELWKQTLGFGRWLSLNPPTPVLGAVLLSAISPQLKNMGPSKNAILSSKVLFSIINEERYCWSTVENSPSPETVLACYMILSRSDNAMELDNVASKVWRSLSVAEFTLFLEMLFEDMSKGRSDFEHLAMLVHTLGAIIHNSPEGTLKVTQAYFSRCISLFANHWEVWLDQSYLRLQVLQFLATHCTERPVSLRVADMNDLLLVLERPLSGSKHHDSYTSRPTFHALITILSALVRMRRDLLIPVLPHFGHVLRRLTTAFRRPRLQLGAKQAQAVAEVIPAWISLRDEGLGALEARAFARLLTNLTTKTIIRTFAVTPTGSEELTGSLARPFSKHAAPVLKAYVDAMNDPLSIITAEVRKELQPGLFALCEMTSEHSRDALVASSLDAGGKAVFKLLWKDWEKQRYVGKG